MTVALVPRRGWGWWGLAVLFSGSLSPWLCRKDKDVLVVSSGSWEPALPFLLYHLKLPVGAEGPFHCHPLGPGLLLRDPFFFACSISEIGGFPSWWRRQQSRGLRRGQATSWENEHLVPPLGSGAFFGLSTLIPGWHFPVSC